MSRESFLNNAEFMEIVRICIITRCTYIEAARVIKRAGFQISLKTFQRAKVELERTRKERMSQIVDELSEYAANSIDTATAVDYELWAIEKTTKNPMVKIKALEMLMKNCGGKTSNFDASPVLDKIAKRLESGKTNGVSKKTEPTDVVADAEKTEPTDVVADAEKTTDSEKHGVEEDLGSDSD